MLIGNVYNVVLYTVITRRRRALHHPVGYGQSPRSSITDFACQPVLVYVSIEQPCQYTELNSELRIESSEPEEDHGLTRHLAVAVKQEQRHNLHQRNQHLGKRLVWCLGRGWRPLEHPADRISFLHHGIHAPSVDLNSSRPIHLDFSFQSCSTDHLPAP